MDRYWVLACFPVVIQEACQFVIWKYGSLDENTTMNSCGRVNKTCSIIIWVFVMLIPVSTAYIQYRTLYEKAAKWRHIFFAVYGVAELLAYLILVILVLDDSDRSCITVGQHGHQDWSYGFTANIMFLYYLPPIVCMFILYQPLWVTFAPCLFMATAYYSFYLLVGDEASSVWCWSGSFLVIWGVIYVHIGKYLRLKFPKQLTMDPNTTLAESSWMQRVFLKGMHQHYEKYAKSKEEVVTSNYDRL